MVTYTLVNYPCIYTLHYRLTTIAQSWRIFCHSSHVTHQSYPMTGRTLAWPCRKLTSQTKTGGICSWNRIHWQWQLPLLHHICPHNSAFNTGHQQNSILYKISNTHDTIINSIYPLLRIAPTQSTPRILFYCKTRGVHIKTGGVEFRVLSVEKIYPPSFNLSGRDTLWGSKRWVVEWG